MPLQNAARETDKESVNSCAASSRVLRTLGPTAELPLLKLTDSGLSGVSNRVVTKLGVDYRLYLSIGGS